MVKTVKYRRLGEDPPPAFYRSLRQQFSPVMTLLVRTATDPRQLIGPVGQHLRTLDPDLAPIAVTTVEDQIEAELKARRGFAGVFLAICGLGLLISSLGLYGVMAYRVRQRRHELALRIALGAPAHLVLGQVLRRSLGLTSVGLALWLLGAQPLTRVLSGMLYGLTPTDPPTMLGVIALLLSVAFAASIIPARRATTIGPMIVLRDE